MRGEHQLRPTRVGLLALEHLHNGPRNIRVNMTIKLVNDYQSATQKNVVYLVGKEVQALRPS